jgi:hypothetical protein
MSSEGSNGGIVPNWVVLQGKRQLDTAHIIITLMIRLSVDMNGIGAVGNVQIGCAGAYTVPTPHGG